MPTHIAPAPAKSVPTKIVLHYYQKRSYTHWPAVMPKVFSYTLAPAPAKAFPHTLDRAPAQSIPTHIGYCSCKAFPHTSARAPAKSVPTHPDKIERSLWTNPNDEKVSCWPRQIVSERKERMTKREEKEKIFKKLKQPHGRTISTLLKNH